MIPLNRDSNMNRDIERDAERYRLLRLFKVSAHFGPSEHCPVGLLAFSPGYRGEDLDRTLDIALGYVDGFASNVPPAITPEERHANIATRITDYYANHLLKEDL